MPCMSHKHQLINLSWLLLWLFSHTSVCGLNQTLVCAVCPVPEQSQAIVIYTGWERHALVGSDIRLSCSFFSWRWTSEDVTFSWTYRPDGSRDSISVMHTTHTHTHTNRGVLDCVSFQQVPQVPHTVQKH